MVKYSGDWVSGRDGSALGINWNGTCWFLLPGKAVSPAFV